MDEEHRWCVCEDCTAWIAINNMASWGVCRYAATEALGCECPVVKTLEAMYDLAEPREHGVYDCPNYEENV